MEMTDRTCTVTNITLDRDVGKRFLTSSAAMRYAKGFPNTDTVFAITRNSDGEHIAYVSRGEEIDYTI